MITGEFLLRAVRASEPLRKEPYHRRIKFPSHQFDEMRHLNGLSDVMNEVDQHADAGCCKSDSDRNREMRDAYAVFDSSNCPQYQNAVQECGNECAED
jgi:hypothetical protein